MKIIAYILIPFLGTSLGSFLVFFMKNKLNSKIEQILIGFASGVMIAASIWSLIMPAIEMAEDSGKIPFLAPALGFSFGIIVLMLLNKLIHKLEINGSKINIKNKFKKNTMLVLAVTLHNIPEGMAVGVAFAGLISGQTGITLASCLALALGIGIQNLPEGAIISMPLKSDGMSKFKAFIYGVLSGIVEPISAFLTILLTSLVVPILPFILSFAAGAMIYVVVSELIPECSNSKYPEIGTIGLMLGFVIMMVLDVALG